LEKLGFQPDIEFNVKNDLRENCSRFLRFAYLLDFLALESLSSIYVNSVVKLVQMLKNLSECEIDKTFISSNDNIMGAI